MRQAILIYLVLSGVARASSLTITQPAVERFEDGAPVFSPELFNPGETVYFSFQVEGFTRKENAVNLTFQAQPKDADGTLLTPPITGEEATRLSPEDKDWKPKLRGSFTLPLVLRSGPCQISIHVKDELSGESASGEIAFQSGGIKLEANPAFAIRNLNFYRNEDEDRPLDIAAFRVGEEIHARFLIVGFRHGDQKSDPNAIDVSYGISVAGASGKALIAEPSAAADKSSGFYPKPYVPGLLTFTLKTGTPSGSYVLTVTATDALGHQTAEAHRSFVLE